MRWVLATANPGKRREFAALLAPLGVELLLQSELGIASIEETGQSFEDNALLKARHAASAARLPALADDSGIEVDALAGAPGIYSARYAGPAASDTDNNRKLLQQLARTAGAQRSARYRCVLAWVAGADVHWGQGRWEGQIAAAPRGSGGFGYDVIFIPSDFECTAAELAAERKNAISHRALALHDLLRELRAAGRLRAPSSAVRSS